MQFLAHSVVTETSPEQKTVKWLQYQSPCRSQVLLLSEQEVGQQKSNLNL
jgi:hypothetical protein